MGNEPVEMKEILTNMWVIDGENSGDKGRGKDYSGCLERNRRTRKKHTLCIYQL